MLLLFIDEWVGFLNSLNKKEQDQTIDRMGQIVMLGRSLNVQAILAMQRPDAVFFRNGARDNFNLIVGMGNMSGDGKRMIFPSDCIDQLQPVTEIGTGYALIGGYDIVDAAVAEKALPYCNIVCITGTEMMDKLSGYLSVLWEQDEASVGGAMPNDDFYYGA